MEIPVVEVFIKERPAIQLDASGKVEDILLSVLEIIDKHGPLDEESGICENICHELEFAWGLGVNPQKLRDIHTLFLDTALLWPKHSGRYFYPVPGPSGADPEGAYEGASNLWEGEYGDSRRELLKFVIQQICNRRTK